VIKKVINRLNLGVNVFLHGQIPTQKRNPIPPLSEDDVTEAREFFPMDKFFIFGHARSGTTLLTRLIRKHPEVHCNYQAHFFTRSPLLSGLVDSPEIENWLSRSSNRWNQGRDLSPLVLRCAADIIMERDARRVGKKIVGDKSPNTQMNGDAVKLLHNLYPDSKLIFIVRDGRDVALSQRFKHFIEIPQHLTRSDLVIRDAFTDNVDPFFNGERSVFTPRAIRKALESWVTNLTETDQMGKELFGDESYISLRYEDLLNDTKTQMQRVWSFLKVPVDFDGVDDAIAETIGINPDAEYQKEKAAEIADPIQKGKPGSWQEIFTEQDKRIFKEIGGETLIEWGYEGDLNW